MKQIRELSLRAAQLLGLILLLAAHPQTAAGLVSGDTWQMKQRDMHNTGRADYEVPFERLNDSFFDVFAWQKPAPGSPGQGGFNATSMVFSSGTGPEGAGIVLGTYHWPKGIQGMDMHDGSLFWQGNPYGGETIAKVTPAFSNDGYTIYVANDATDSTEYPDGHPLMGFDTDLGPQYFRHNGFDPEPWHMSKNSPTVGPRDLIYMHDWNGSPHAAYDDGFEITEEWAASTGSSACLSDPAIYVDSYDELFCIQGGRDGIIHCWTVDYEDEFWAVGGCGHIDAAATIDPATGFIYVPSGLDDIWITGLDAGGDPLWSSPTLQVYEYLPGTNNPQRAQATGCLSHDGATYYFQTNSNQGDGRLYAINTGDGSIKWSWETGSLGWEMVSSSPIVTPNGVIVIGNNLGDTYFALQDDGAQAILLDTIAVNSDATDHGHALASATLSAEGLLYLPLRTWWTMSNGDGDAPTAAIANVYSAFDLKADAIASLPAPGGQMCFALDNSVQIFWDEIVDPGGDFDHYAIYRDTAPFTDVSGMTAITTITDIAMTTHLDDTAVNGTSYWYTVTTVTGDAQQQMIVEAIGPRTPRYSHDLQVVSISRSPRFPRYCPEYTLYEITDPSGFGPYFCSVATGLGCGQDEFTQRRPEIDDVVTYTATIRNRGTVTIYDMVDVSWTVDGAPHDTGDAMAFLEPDDITTFSTELAWDDLSHEIGFEMTYYDDRPENNTLAIDTKSVAFFSCIDRSRLENFREGTANYPAAATDDFIDWLNRHMARLNEMFATAGCAKRVHYDTLPLIGDADPDPEIENIEFAIFPFRYAVTDGSLRTSGYYRPEQDLDYGLLHEWGHQLGLIDIYRLNLEPWLNEVNGEAYTSVGGLMMNCSEFISEHSANAMNSWQDIAHGYFGQYLYSLPEQVKLRITDLEGRPLRCAQVRVFQKEERPDVGEVLSNQVKFTGVTDEMGEWILPNVEIDPLLAPPCPSGDTLNDNPFGYVNVTGSNGLLLIEVEYDGIVNYVWLDIVEVNNAFWGGQTDTVVVERQVSFGDHMFALPDELTELNAHQWSGHADMGATVTLTDDGSRTVVGSASVKYDTNGAYDTWMRYPGSGNARWNLSSMTSFEFDIYAENENEYGFQSHSPWIFLRCEHGSYEYHSADEALNAHLDSWVHFTVPVGGNADWVLTTHGTPDLGDVRAIEFHADTWGDGFILWIDGFRFDLGEVAVNDEGPVPALVLGQNMPNPFNPTTKIVFALPEAGSVQLQIIDAAGRRVRTLVNERLEVGRHEVTWDGRDDTGHRQGSGLYLYRLEAGGHALTRKMLLLK
ncbi:MAG: T9SS type A sorting domain-containing protein [bacterium]|nr:T9SS type A sorting domain-containing protein [bacterium]